MSFALLAMLATIIIWLYISNKLPVAIQRGIVVVIDLVAIVLFAVATLDLFERAIILFGIVMLALFWIAKCNRLRKRIDWEETKIVDMLFVIGVVIITLVLDVFK